MQANNSRAAAQLYAHDTTAGAGASSLPKLILAVVLLTAVWAFARFGHEVTAVPPIAPLTAGAFAQPQDFVATPGDGNLHINVRAGAGAEYRVKEQVERGQTLVGIARATDSGGAFWIELSDGRGFAKESVLAPASGPSPPAVRP